MNEIERLGNLYGEDKGTGYAGNVWNKDKISPTLTAMEGGNRQPMIIEDFYKNREPRAYDETAPTIRAEREGLKVIVASRGRNPDNPSDRKQGIELEQRLEPNSEGICNTLTSVQKDNYVLEPKIQKVGNIYPSKGQNGEIYQVDGISPALRSGQGLTGSGIGSNNSPKIAETPYRIRKLTPKECWRLMGFTDEDFYKAEEVNSNTQLYKQAGNSIVVKVLEAIFKQML